MGAEFLKKFWGRVDRSGGCWLWTGPRFNHGYGMVTFGGIRNGLAHRVSFLIHNDQIPEGMWVLHRCDNRLCVNPAHLYAGTQQDNMRDMIERRRYYGWVRPEAVARGDKHGSRTRPERVARGERVASAKLSERSVLEIRRLAAAGGSQKQIAQQFGVHVNTVRYIVRRKLWKHI